MDFFSIYQNLNEMPSPAWVAGTLPDAFHSMHFVHRQLKEKHPYTHLLYHMM